MDNGGIASLIANLRLCVVLLLFMIIVTIDMINY